jgi:hypothetical protein
VAHHAVDFLATIIRNNERVHPVRLKLSSRQTDDRLLCLQFAIAIARGICDRVAAKIMCRCSAAASGADAYGLSGATPHIVKGKVDDESWCGLSSG